jgi:hypothetical protein
MACADDSPLGCGVLRGSPLGRYLRAVVVDALFDADPVALPMPPETAVENGEVFTRRWVVDLIPELGFANFAAAIAGRVSYLQALPAETAGDQSPPL